MSYSIEQTVSKNYISWPYNNKYYSWTANCTYFSFYFSLDQKFLDWKSEQKISNKIYKKLQSGSTDA